MFAICCWILGTVGSTISIPVVKTSKVLCRSNRTWQVHSVNLWERVCTNPETSTPRFRVLRELSWKLTKGPKLEMKIDPGAKYNGLNKARTVSLLLLLRYSTQTSRLEIKITGVASLCVHCAPRKGVWRAGTILHRPKGVQVWFHSRTAYRIRHLSQQFYFSPRDHVADVRINGLK